MIDFFKELIWHIQHDDDVASLLALFIAAMSIVISIISIIRAIA